MKRKKTTKIIKLFVNFLKNIYTVFFIISHINFYININNIFIKELKHIIKASCFFLSNIICYLFYGRYWLGISPIELLKEIDDLGTLLSICASTIMWSYLYFLYFVEKKKKDEINKEIRLNNIIEGILGICNYLIVFYIFSGLLEKKHSIIFVMLFLVRFLLNILFERKIFNKILILSNYFDAIISKRKIKANKKYYEIRDEDLNYSIIIDDRFILNLETFLNLNSKYLR